MFPKGSKLNSFKQPFAVIVEGNIGWGKTSFLEYFRHYNVVEVVTEPVEK